MFFVVAFIVVVVVVDVLSVYNRKIRFAIPILITLAIFINNIILLNIKSLKNIYN